MNNPNNITNPDDSNLILYPLEIDFYFPDLCFGIEINELRSHSERANNKDKKGVSVMARRA